MTVAPEQTRAIARITAAQTALDEAQIDPRLIMAAKAIQLMAGQDDKGNPKISADMALAAAMYQAGTGQLLGRDFYVNEKIGRMEGYRGVSRDAVDRGVGEVKIEYRPITAAEADDHEIMAGDTAVACEVYQLRAWRLCQQMGQPYTPISGVGVVRRMEKYDKKTTERWDDNTRRKVPLPEAGWKFRTLEGGNTWRKIAGNRAYKEALRHVPGAPASALEVLEEATIAGMTEQPPETARLTMDQAIEWAKQHTPDNVPDWGSVEDAEFTHEEAKPAPATQAAATDAAFEALPSASQLKRERESQAVLRQALDTFDGNDALPSASAERASGNGKTTPPASAHSERPFKDQGSAVQWACRFPHYQKRHANGAMVADVPHAVGAIQKICKDLGCSERDVDTWADAFMDHVAVKVSADLQAELDKQAASDELPVFESR